MSRKSGVRSSKTPKWYTWTWCINDKSYEQIQLGIQELRWLSTKDCEEFSVAEQEVSYDYPLFAISMTPLVKWKKRYYEIFPRMHLLSIRAMDTVMLIQGNIGNRFSVNPSHTSTRSSTTNAIRSLLAGNNQLRFFPWNSTNITTNSNRDSTNLGMCLAKRSDHQKANHQHQEYAQSPLHMIWSLE